MFTGRLPSQQKGVGIVMTDLYEPCVKYSRLASQYYVQANSLTRHRNDFPPNMMPIRFPSNIIERVRNITMNIDAAVTHTRKRYIIVKLLSYVSAINTFFIILKNDESWTCFYLERLSTQQSCFFMIRDICKCPIWDIVKWTVDDPVWKQVWNSNYISVRKQWGVITTPCFNFNCGWKTYGCYYLFMI